MSNQLKVWDPLVRVFHWSLVLFFTISYLSGEEDSSIHIYSGYIVLGLISFRLIWGVVGTKYARFRQFVVKPEELVEYSKDFIKLSPKHYTGHNPLGGWMVIALLSTLFIVSLSGLQLYAVEEGQGPFADMNSISLISSAYADSDDDHPSDHKKDNSAEEFWEDIHEGSAEFMVFLIFLHIGGVLVSSMVHRENLVKAMITGRKNR